MAALGAAPGRGLAIVLAKPPRPGEVKTRLAGAIGLRGAALLARAFLADSWAQIAGLPWARPVLATTEAASPAEFGLPDGTEIWLQGDGDLGQRLERLLRQALAVSPFAIAIGADTPGLPGRLLDQAHRLIGSRDTVLGSCDAVLGPCADGGFYLIGLRRCPPGLLADLPWSQPTTFDRTRARFESRGITVGILDPWFDVDRPDDLVELEKHLARGAVSCPETARILAAFERDGVGRPFPS